MVKKRSAKAYLALIAVALICVPAVSQAQTKTTLPEDIVKAIYDKFISYDIKTMTYDETRVTSHEQTGGKQPGSMKIDPMNTATLKTRYFFQAPDRHGYRVISAPIENYWAGSPNQPGALPMDRNWLDKVLKWFDIHRAPDESYRNVKCHKLVLIPKPGAPENLYTMTWYVDSVNFVVLKFVFMIRDANNRNIRSSGELFYENFNGRYLASNATWRTKVSILPYVFVHKSVFDNYTFNMPLDESVFLEEFPAKWFEALDEKNPFDK